jgi:hypothetical protein
MPLVYYLIPEWCGNFHYRVEIDILWFIGGFHGTDFIAIVIVSVQAEKALHSIS